MTPKKFKGSKSDKAAGVSGPISVPPEQSVAAPTKATVTIVSPGAQWDGHVVVSVRSVDRMLAKKKSSGAGRKNSLEHIRMIPADFTTNRTLKDA